MNSSSSSLWIISLFPLYFAGLWCFVLFVLSRTAWNRMARFKATSIVGGRKWGFQAARIGGVRYNGALEVTVGSEGIGLSVFPLFSLFHPPLFLPYSALSGPVESRVWGMTQQEYEVNLEDKPDGKRLKIIFVNNALVNAIETERRNSPFSP